MSHDASYVSPGVFHKLLAVEVEYTEGGGS